MKKSRRPSFQKTLAFAATVAALGASVGVPVERALAASPTPGTEKGAKSSLSGNGAVQQKADRKQGMGATQIKMNKNANQYKENKARAIGGNGGAGSNSMLNPQPLPPKQGLGGNSAGQSPAIQK